MIQFYHTTIESVDFQKDAEKSRQQINFWVESQSQGKKERVVGALFHLKEKSHQPGVSDC